MHYLRIREDLLAHRKKTAFEFFSQLNRSEQELVIFRAEAEDDVLMLAFLAYNLVQKNHYRKEKQDFGTQN